MAIKRLTSPVEKKIADRLRQCREDRNLTQQQLAELASCSTGYISEIERLKKRPSLEFVYRLASAMGMTASELLRGTDRRSRRDEMKRRVVSTLDTLRNQIESYLDC